MGHQAKHSTDSVYREKALEHLFIGEVLKLFWNKNETNVEILRCEFDRGGYDIVISKGDVSRFVQFKAVLQNGKTTKVTVSLNLATKPNACIVLITIDDALNMVGYRWFGGKVGDRFPDLSKLPVTKHTKGDASGEKTVRSGHRNLKLNAFEKCANLELLLEKMFA